MGEDYYPSSQAPEGYAMSQANLDHGASDTSSRVSDWIENNGAIAPRAASTIRAPSTVASRNPPPTDIDAPPRILRRTVTTTTTTTYERTPTSTSDEGGVAGAVAGILGAAVGMGVGAALTYTSMKSDNSRSAPSEQPTRLLQPMTSHPRAAPSERGDWVEVDRAAELPQYLADYGYTTAPSVVRSAHSSASARPRTVVSATQPGPMLLTAADARSHVGSQYSAARQSNASRHQSVVGGDTASHVSMGSRASGMTARPATQTPQSQAGSRFSATPRGIAQRAPADMDSASRVSGRSQRSATASRPGGPPAPSVYGGSVTPSRAPSTMSGATMKAPTVIRAAAPSNSGRKGSVVSARYVPLPKSSAGSSHSSKWDDLGSIGPHDSISCVGSPQ